MHRSRTTGNRVARLPLDAGENVRDDTLRLERFTLLDRFCRVRHNGPVAGVRPGLRGRRRVFASPVSCPEGMETTVAAAEQEFCKSDGGPSVVASWSLISCGKGGLQIRFYMGGQIE